MLPWIGCLLVTRPMGERENERERELERGRECEREGNGIGETRKRE